MKQRTQFNFYRSYYDSFKALKDNNDKLLFIETLLDKQFQNINPQDLTPDVELLYVSIKHSVEKQIEGWENKTKSKLTASLPPTEPPSQAPSYPPSLPPSVQEEEEEKEKGEEEEATTLLFTTTTPLNTTDNIDKEIEQLFCKMFVEFEEDENNYRPFLDYWWSELSIQEKDDSVYYSTNFLKYCRKNRKKTNLYWYLKDKKFNWNSIRNLTY